MAYTKGEKIKLTMFWCTIISVIFFVLEGIIAVASQPLAAIAVLFAIAVIFAIIAGSLLIYVKVKRTNRKITA